MALRSLLVLVLGAASFAEAFLSDLNCTTTAPAGTVFSPLATNCLDQASIEACQQMFGGTSPDPAVITGRLVATRPKGCFTINSGAVLSNEVKKAAIYSCPNYCGYCCLSPEYDCKNLPYPRIDCSRVSPDMCRDPLWREIVALDCPSACGFCKMGGCIDAAMDCASQPSICTTPALVDFAKQNCKRTCGLCAGTQANCAITMGPCSATRACPAGSVCNGSDCCADCSDQNSKCAQYAQSGFCTNPFYSDEEKKTCAKTCGLC